MILEGVRTPFTKAGTLFAEISAIELGRLVLRECVERAGLDPQLIDEVILGHVAGPVGTTNPARAMALLAQLPPEIPAFAVESEGASGLRGLVEAAYRIRQGDAAIVLAAGVESMSSAAHPAVVAAVPSRRRGLRPRRPRAALDHVAGLADLPHGARAKETAERLAREFALSRQEQDAWALASHCRAGAAWSGGALAREVVPVPIPPTYDQAVRRDNAVRDDLTEEYLARLRPLVDPRWGTVTAGNSSPPADGAVALLLASASRARELGLPAMGRLRAWGFAGCDASLEGLGPVLAAAMALRRADGPGLERIDLIEMHEVFAAQALACLRACESRRFCEKNLGRGPLGTPDPQRVNVNGGAIALGHPLGASGGRLVLTLLHELRRRGAGLGLVASSAGGGQGAAVVVERI